MKRRIPEKQGLYDPRFEHDSCGVGFVCDVGGRPSADIVREGLQVLARLSHRGATGADPKTGDGAGILIQIPHEFFEKVCSSGAGIKLPPKGDYATGLIFLPTDQKESAYCKKALTRMAREEGQSVIGWRKVPVDSREIGATAKATQPEMAQVFIQKDPAVADILAFERSLYMIRKKTENAIRASRLKQKDFFYITNLSARTLAYKGLLMPEQLGSYFLDLKDPDLKSAIALVHSRYSTNTFPTWDLAQPFRFIAHNGEINTLRGNINWMRAREGLLSNGLLGKKVKEILPVIVPGGSDSATLDNVFELLVLSGRSIAHAAMMLIPAAWEHNDAMNAKLKDFYRYHSCVMEPWDGPAAIAFTDGVRIGACLDRNGLRPARYIITKSGHVVMASEVGVLDIPASEISESGRLEPGKIFFINTELGRIMGDEELKDEVARKRPYGEWAKDNTISFEMLPAPEKRRTTYLDVPRALKASGYTREDIKTILKPMAEKASEPVGSMGSDTPHAALSAKPQLVFNYFKQLFAQVTNPPIDPIREELVMSLVSYVGPEKDLLSEGPDHCHKLLVRHPVILDEELSKLSDIKMNGFKTSVLSTLFDVSEKNGLTIALDRVCREGVAAINEGSSFIILSDRGLDSGRCALPALLAIGALHHHLLDKAMRARVGIIVESAEPREVHHFALLFAYGADCVNPYLALRAVEGLVGEGEVISDVNSARKNYIKSVEKGILKILSKMGISTLSSYKGAQIFEAIGIGPDVIDRCFSGTASRIGGVSFDDIRRDCLIRHSEAFPKNGLVDEILETGGVYQWKKDGEFHLWNPDSISRLQDAARSGDYKKYKEFAALINDQSKNPTTIRSLFKFKPARPIPIGEVEPVSEITKRFATGAMSFGSISRSAHESIAIAMNKLNGRSNTGEGGEDPARFNPEPNGDSKRSAIKQVASGRFGVTTHYLVNADELQIKMAQGAKPGEGGQLPGHKVSQIIARTRYTTPGVTLISPPPHHDIYSIEDLAQLIFDLKNVNPKARISVKLVSEIGVGTIAAGVAKGHADMILISGGDGGTGASPLSSIKHAGIPWELGLSETHQTLVLNDLRSRVRLQTDGQIRTGRDVIIAAMLGAEEFGFATAILIVLGCVMLRHCHLNNCSVGVATQDEHLEHRFTGRADHIINYLTFIAEEAREIMASLGIRCLDDLIGHTELIEQNMDMKLPRGVKVDLAGILHKPLTENGIKTRCCIEQDHGLKNVLDKRLLKSAENALKDARPVNISYDIRNCNRSVGAMLSGAVASSYGESGLPEDTIRCKFTGIAGQSFGAFLIKGITFELEGMANDYVGKGMFGGKLAIYPPKGVSYKPEDNIIIGNTTFYGAINGEAYIRGAAGERFCIRNSGVSAVVEGVGDHGCEYMTGGCVAVLGRTGRNFAAGMSGGVAYVYDADGNFRSRCNREMVDLEVLEEEDVKTLRDMVVSHHRYTKSALAKEMLDNFSSRAKLFVKVMPKEYKRILENKKIDEKLDLAEVSDG